MSIHKHLAFSRVQAAVKVFACVLFTAGVWVVPVQSERMGGDASPWQGRQSQMANTQRDLGSVSGNVYTNKGVGITYTFPQGWFVNKTATDKQNGSVKESGGNPSPFHNGYNLLTVSKLPEETALCGNCSSTRVRGPHIRLDVSTVAPSDDQTAVGIQNSIKRLFDGKGKFRVIRGPEVCSFGGQTFSRMDATNGTTYQGDAITIRKPYQIEFQFFADSPEQLEELYDTLNSLRSDH
jgi:hypothetical protein